MVAQRDSRSLSNFPGRSSPAPSGTSGSDRVVSFRSVLRLIQKFHSMEETGKCSPLFDAQSLLHRYAGYNQSRSGSSLAPFPPCCCLSLATRLWLCPGSWKTDRPRVSPCSQSSPSEVLWTLLLFTWSVFSPARSGHAYPRVGE